MLSVFFGWDKTIILDVDTYFNHVYEEEWFNDPFVREMIQDIDNSTVLSSHCIQSPAFGQIPPTMLSGGVKSCIMLYKMPNFYTDLMVFGENCEPWLCKIFKSRDIIKLSCTTVDLGFVGLDIEGICENDGSMFHNSDEWIDKMLDFVEEMGSCER